MVIQVFSFAKVYLFCLLVLSKSVKGPVAVSILQERIKMEYSYIFQWTYTLLSMLYIIKFGSLKKSTHFYKNRIHNSLLKDVL